MNKREFIKVLEEKLSVLEESELRDIINEYKDTIDEKVKHGKTEIEAVEDFGSVDELVKEILQAYKINPKYVDSRGKSTTKEVAQDFETFVKKGAKSLADFSRSVYEDFKNSDQPLTIELVFEILIKVVILLVLFAILRLPFMFIHFLGKSILETAFFPLDSVLLFVWAIVIWCLYIILCVLVGIAMFKQVIRFNDSDKKDGSKKVKKNTISEDFKEKVVKAEEVKKEKKSIVKDDEKISENFFTRGKDDDSVEKKSDGSLGTILSGIFKVFIVIFCLIPLWFIDLAIFTLLVVAIYYLFIGINVLGLVIMFSGFLISCVYLSRIFYNIAFNRKKVYFMPFVVSLVFIVIGGLLTAEMMTRIDYVDSAPKVNFSQTTEEFEFNLVENENVYLSVWYYNNFEKNVDNNLEDGAFKVEVTYYDKLVNRLYVEKNQNVDGTDYQNVIDIYYDQAYENSIFFTLYKEFIGNLKKNKMYDYEKLFELQVKITANENTIKAIK